MAQKFTLYSVFEAVDKITTPMKKINASLKSYGDSIKSANKIGSMFTGALGALGVSASIAGIVAYGKEVKAVAMQQAALSVAYRSVFGKDATNQLDFARRAAKDLGLGQQVIAESYMKIAASAQGTKNAGKDVQNVFLGIAKAGTALQMNDEAIQGSLYAVSQMMSKGKVQAEELRGQLGERLPGAFNIAARAMGVTTAKLDKMMQLGQLTAEKFIPRFAAQLEKEFGKSSAEASKGFLGVENRFKNLVNTVQGKMGSALLPALSKLYDKLSPMIERFGQWVDKNKEVIGQNIVTIVMGIAGAFQFLATNMENGVIPAFVTFVGLLKVFSAVAVALPAIIAFFSNLGFVISAVATGAATLGEAMLFLMGPVGWVIGGIALAGAGIALLSTQVGGLGNAFLLVGQYIAKGILIPVNMVMDAIKGIWYAMSFIPGLGETARGGIAGLTALQGGMNNALSGSAGAYDFVSPYQNMVASKFADENKSMSSQHSYSSSVRVGFDNLPEGATVSQSSPAPGFSLDMGQTAPRPGQ